MSNPVHSLVQDNCTQRNNVMNQPDVETPGCWPLEDRTCVGGMSGGRGGKEACAS